MKVIAVTNRKLCSGDDNFFSRVEMLAKLDFHAIILREKDLTSQEFNFYAEKCNKICQNHNAKLIINSFADTAIENDIPYLHFGYDDFMNFSNSKKGYFSCIGISVHSVEEAVEACRNGANYLIAGHIFYTNCKLNIPPRGTKFLENICKSVNIPVFGIGGITPENASSVISSGAEGVCIMSPTMTLSEEELKAYMR